MRTPCAASIGFGVCAGDCADFPPLPAHEFYYITTNAPCGRQYSSGRARLGCCLSWRRYDRHRADRPSPCRCDIVASGISVPARRRRSMICGYDGLAAATMRSFRRVLSPPRLHRGAPDMHAPRAGRFASGLWRHRRILSWTYDLKRRRNSEAALGLRIGGTAPSRTLTDYDSAQRLRRSALNTTLATRGHRPGRFIDR